VRIGGHGRNGPRRWGVKQLGERLKGCVVPSPPAELGTGSWTVPNGAQCVMQNASGVYFFVIGEPLQRGGACSVGSVSCCVLLVGAVGCSVPSSP